MNTRAMFLATALLATILAGCADGTVEQTDADDEKFNEIVGDEKVDDSKGVIRGVVVDDAIVPLAGVTVIVESDGRSALTTDDGLFAFANVEPGFQNLLVDKDGYQETTVQVSVDAGVAKPPTVQIQLTPDPSELPLVLPLKYDGHIACSITTPAYRVAVCSVPNIVTDALGEDPLIDDRFMATYPELQPDVAWMQNEMVWESTQSAGDHMALVVEVATNDEDRTIGETNGPSPLVTRADQIMLDNATFADYFQMRVFNFEHPATTPPVPICGIPFPLTGPGCIKGVGATLQQDYAIYSHLFYNFVPDESWQFSVDGSPTTP